MNILCLKTIRKIDINIFTIGEIMKDRLLSIILFLGLVSLQYTNASEKTSEWKTIADREAIKLITHLIGESDTYYDGREKRIFQLSGERFFAKGSAWVSLKCYKLSLPCVPDDEDYRGDDDDV